MTLQEAFAEIRNKYPQQVAEELLSVQPMNEDIDWQAVGEAFERMAAYRRSLGIHCVHDEIFLRKCGDSAETER